MSLNVLYLQEWTGRTESRSDHATQVPVAALAATLDLPQALPHDGDAVPPLWHWLYFLPISPLAEAGHDGHPKRGGFLPPVDLPRRMWAGSRLTFHQPLHIGDAMNKTSTIVSVDGKKRRGGALVLVTVRLPEFGKAATPAEMRSSCDAIWQIEQSEKSGYLLA